MQRLELIRALREVGELSIATIKQTLAALEAGVGEHGDVPSLVVALDALRTTGAGPASDTWDPAGDSAEVLRYAVLGTVLFEAVVLILRRLAHVDRSRRLATRRTPRRTG